MKKIDLHIHTTASDGSLSPREIVDWAIKRGLKTIAITDHETVKGLKEAILYAKGKDIEIVSGIEIVCDDPKLEIFDVDVLGLFVDYSHSKIKNIDLEMKSYQKKQKAKIIRRLNEMGFKVTIDELERESSGAYYWRRYLAKVLFRKYSNNFRSVNEVFDKYLGIKSKEYVFQSEYSFVECIKRIKEAGGVAILAHPGRLYNRADKVIEQFLKCGGDGIEVDYSYSDSPNFSKQDEEELNKKFRTIAKKRKVLVSGGTDFHNKRDNNDIGTFGVSKKEFMDLKEKSRSKK